jgi:hypothetical protein
LDVVMAEISRSHPVAGDPDVVWAVLADFGALSRWADGVEHSCLLNVDSHPESLGLSRRIQCGRDAFVGTITAFEPPRLLAYDIAGVPRAYSVSNRWTLEPTTGDVAVTSVTVTTAVQTASARPRPLGERVLARLIGKRSEILLSSLAVELGGTS